MSNPMITRYFKATGSSSDTHCRLPNPSGPLANSVPSSAIAAGNREVRRAVMLAREGKRRGKYNKYSSEERAALGKFASENGTNACLRKYQKNFEFLNESTVRRFKNTYREEVARRRKETGQDDVTVKKLMLKKQGRPVIFGKSLDVIIQKYISSIRDADGIVNTPIVIAGARGIIRDMDRTMLAEYGGPASLTQGWANSILKRMNFTRRAGTTQAKIAPKQFEEQQNNFLQEIIDIVTMENIPPHLIINWDQTGLYLVPSSNWTMAQKGNKRIPIRGLQDKRMITGVFCGSMIGEFLPVQLIYGGKTDRCHPISPFPSEWDITHNAKHWSNETTMVRYLNNVIVPFITSTRALLGLDDDHAALAIFDCFRGQVTDRIVSILEEHSIHSVVVPANCTDRLQPLDLTVNKMAKAFLQRKFQEWYAKEVSTKFNASAGVLEELVDLSTSRMKNIGVSWLIQMHNHITEAPVTIVNGFLAANIPQSIDAGIPVISHTTNINRGDDDGDDELTDDYLSGLEMDEDELNSHGDEDCSGSEMDDDELTADEDCFGLEMDED